MNQAVGRISSFAAVIILWGLEAIKALFDLIGYSTVPDDAKVAGIEIKGMLDWLAGIPWWITLPALVLLTALLIVNSWPGPATAVSAAPEPRERRQPKPRSPDIAWSFDNPAFPHMGFIGMGGGPFEKGITIYGFQADGINLTGKPLTRIKTHIRSNVTNETFQVYFVVRGTRYAPDDTHGIPIGASFTVSSEPLLKDGKLMNDEQFKAKFSNFRFEFGYDRKTYVRDFNAEEIERNLSWFRSLAWPDRFPIPRVVPKDGAKPGPGNPVIEVEFQPLPLPSIETEKPQ